MISRLCIMLVILTCSVAAAELSFYSYAIPLQYESVNKKDLLVLGTTATLGWDAHLVELELDTLNHVTGNRVAQQGVMVAYSYYGTPYTTLRVGAHRLTNLDTNLTGYVGFLEGKFDQLNLVGYRQATLGLAGYYSTYSDGISVFQLSPSYTAYFEPAWPYGQYSITSMYHVSKASVESNIRAYSQVIAKAKFGSFSYQLNVAAGASRYGVLSGGSVVYNAPDVVGASFGAAMTYWLSESIMTQVGYQHQTLVVDQELTETGMDRYEIMLGIRL